MLGLGAIVIAIELLLLLAEPYTMGPSRRLGDDPIVWAIVAGALIAFLTMVRIDRSARNPESHRSFWRSASR
jgi:hypothetical protein